MEGQIFYIDLKSVAAVAVKSRQRRRSAAA